MTEHRAGVPQTKINVWVSIHAGEFCALRVLNEQRHRRAPISHPVQGHAEQEVLLGLLCQLLGFRVLGEECGGFAFDEGADVFA